jgi:hypothetical protein
VPLLSPIFLPLRTLREVGLITLLTGCAGGLAGWQRVESTPALDFTPRQQVQVWHDGRSDIWHRVRPVPDSLSGIPYHRPLDCDSCRVCLPLGAIDSLRLGRLERAGMMVGALPFLGLASVILALRLDWGND